MGKALRVKNDRKARIHYLLLPILRTIYIIENEKMSRACVQTADTAVLLLELQYAARGQRLKS